MQRKSSSRPKKPAVTDLSSSNPFALSFDMERYYRGERHYWAISAVQNPDELLSWGHAPTRELAEQAAGIELEALSSGRSRGRKAKQATKSAQSR